MGVFQLFKELLRGLFRLLGFSWQEEFQHQRQKISRIKRNIYRLIFFYILFSYFFFSYIGFPIIVKERAMLPSIARGELLFFNRLKLGIKKPFLYDSPNAFLNFNMPKPGDVVALQSPNKEKSSLVVRILDFPFYFFSLGLYKLDKREFVVRRVLGLPGDKIRLEDKTIFLNDKAFVPEWPLKFEDERVLPDFLSRRDNVHEIVIPGGYIFVLSDYWDIVADSRSFGLIPLQNIDAINSAKSWPTD